jgi:ABC-type Na+ transport system ATPase subunit NatA
VPPLKHISIQGYRAARELQFEPGSVCALVGEASSGKSTVLTAIWTLLEAAAPPPTIDDVSSHDKASSSCCGWSGCSTRTCAVSSC